MTIAEILKQNGVADDAITAIQNAMKEHKIFTSSEENLDIRYGKLKTDHESTTKQLSEANALIESLKKGNKDNEGLQTKIADYEEQIATLKTQLANAQLESEIKVGLLSESVKDVDYLTFKLKEKGELKLGEDGKIVGWADKIAALKTQLPDQFASGDGGKKFEENKLPEGNQTNNGITKEAFDKMGYADRAKLYKDDPTTYAELVKG